MEKVWALLGQTYFEVTSLRGVVNELQTKVMKLEASLKDTTEDTPNKGE